MKQERQELLNVNTGRSDGSIAMEKYVAMKKALLRVIPKNADGIPFKGLSDRVRPHLPSKAFEGASVGWYLTAVKLDLEARGLIERIPKKKPQHLRRC